MKKASILDNLQYNENRPAVSVLMETDLTKEIRIVLRKNQSMAEHTAPYPITVEVADGAIDFGVEKEVHHLKRGDLISLTGNVPHDLKALADSVIRLTLSKGDHASRVETLVGK